MNVNQDIFTVAYQLVRVLLVLLLESSLHTESDIFSHKKINLTSHCVSGIHTLLLKLLSM